MRTEEKVLSKRELSAIIAALRYWQREGLFGDPVRELNLASGESTTVFLPREPVIISKDQKI